MSVCLCRERRAIRVSVCTSRLARIRLRLDLDVEKYLGDGGVNDVKDLLLPSFQPLRNDRIRLQRSNFFEFQKSAVKMKQTFLPLL